jgi:2-keto-myo-inositol isomerase
MPIRFALNRTCAPQMSLADFITLAVSSGVTAVEIRNDVEGREFADGTPANEVKARLDAAGLGVASVNALQRFNEWTPARAKEAEAIIAYAATLGAPGVVLCPVHNEDHGWTDAEAERNLRDGLKKLLPILKDHGITGYVEPLGMKGSTMKRQSMAIEAVSDVDGWDAYELCFDTFQFFRCGDNAMHYDRIGLAHMSGISRPDLKPDELTAGWSSLTTASTTSGFCETSSPAVTPVLSRWNRSVPPYRTIRSFSRMCVQALSTYLPC